MDINLAFHKLRQWAIRIGAWLTLAAVVLGLIGGVLFLLNLYTLSH